jgi:transcription initiation factor TFIIIB Brf1 subunit/transcription initiation factor TFIIB
MYFYLFYHRLNTLLLDRAFSFYKLALGYKFTTGRKSSHVSAACVYLACRTEGTGRKIILGQKLLNKFYGFKFNIYSFTDLMIDIADSVDIDVNAIGRTYTQLHEALNINIPTIGEYISFF